MEHAHGGETGNRMGGDQGGDGPDRPCTLRHVRRGEDVQQHREHQRQHAKGADSRIAHDLQPAFPAAAAQSVSHVGKAILVHGAGQHDTGGHRQRGGDHGWSARPTGKNQDCAGKHPDHSSGKWKGAQKTGAHGWSIRPVLTPHGQNREEHQGGPKILQPFFHFPADPPVPHAFSTSPRPLQRL